MQSSGETPYKYLGTVAKSDRVRDWDFSHFAPLSLSLSLSHSHALIPYPPAVEAGAKVIADG